MSSISLYVSFKKESKESVLLSLENHVGYVTEVSDILNVIVYYTHPKNADKIIKIKGVTSVADKYGNYVER